MFLHVPTTHHDIFYFLLFIWNVWVAAGAVNCRRVCYETFSYIQFYLRACSERFASASIFVFKFSFSFFRSRCATSFKDARKKFHFLLRQREEKIINVCRDATLRRIVLHTLRQNNIWLNNNDNEKRKLIKIKKLFLMQFSISRAKLSHIACKEHKYLSLLSK